MITYQKLLVLREFLGERDPMCGAEIMRSINDRFKAEKIRSGVTYKVLASLKRKGWIEHVASLPAPNEPVAHFYRMTPAGRAAFLGMLARLTIPDYLWRTPDA